ncbi:FtsQ-type POTRA domain-containing protein [Microbacterium sp. 22242]|uniref:FtsQ-type POTRA domain-containing protein n=1 Tax=Microbacterium sp. 22242 TaxID=3453896 RepID=UPI003F85BA2A
MRRPSAIPTSAPPTERAEPARSAAPSTQARILPADVRPPHVGFREDAAPQRTAAPIPLDAASLRGESTPSADPAESGAGQGDGPLTARDLWQAARARRRALRAEIRRFTQRSRRRRIGWAVAALVAVLVVGGSVGAAYSPLFAVQTISVEGTSALKARDVQKALSSQLGRPLALVDSSAVKAALVGFPLIETYQLEAHPPHDLVVKIVERTPVGVVASERGFTVVDAAGVPLSTTDDRPAGYALIDLKGGTDASSFRGVGVVLRTLPAALRAQVDSVTAPTPDDITLQLSSGTKIVWGSPDQSALKATTLQKLMAASPDHGMYDVSSPNVGVVG